MPTGGGGWIFTDTNKKEIGAAGTAAQMSHLLPLLHFSFPFQENSFGMRITIYIFKTTPYCKPSNCINKVYPCERSGALAQGLPVSLISMPGALLDCFDLIFELADILLKKKKKKNPPFFKSCQGEALRQLTQILLLPFKAGWKFVAFLPPWRTHGRPRSPRMRYSSAGCQGGKERQQPLPTRALAKHPPVPAPGSAHLRRNHFARMRFKAAFAIGQAPMDPLSQNTDAGWRGSAPAQSSRGLPLSADFREALGWQQLILFLFLPKKAAKWDQPPARRC